MRTLKDRSWWQVLLLLAGGFILFTVLYALGQAFQPEAYWLRIAVSIMFSVCLLGLYALAVRIFEKKCAGDLQVNKMFHIISGFGIGLAFFCVVTGILILTGNCKLSYSQFSAWAFFIPLAQYFFVACGEEVIFRGVFFRIIDEKWGFVWALVINSLLFGLMHITNPNCTLWTALAIAIEAGLLLSAAYKWSGTLWLPIGIHWAWNFVEGPVLGTPVSGMSAYDSIFKSALSGSDIMTGGSFGVEGSIVTVIVGSAISALLIYGICRRRNYSAKSTFLPSK